MSGPFFLTRFTVGQFLTSRDLQH